MRQEGKLPGGTGRRRAGAGGDRAGAERERAEGGLGGALLWRGATSRGKERSAPSARLERTSAAGAPWRCSH